MVSGTPIPDPLERARRNYRCYERLRQEREFPEWAATLLFYVALQLVLAHARLGGHVLTDDHAAIRRYVDRYLVSVRRSYRQLFALSRDARYTGTFPDDETVGRYHDGALGHIVGHLRSRGIEL